MRIIQILTLSSVILLGCGQKSSSDEASTTETSEEDDGDEETIQAEKLALALSTATPAQSFEIASQTIKKVDNALETSAGALAAGTLSIETSLLEDQQQGDQASDTADYASKWCTVNGDPVDQPSDEFTSLLATNIGPRDPNPDFS